MALCNGLMKNIIILLGVEPEKQDKEKSPSCGHSRARRSIFLAEFND